MLILCGGRGTRLQQQAESIPKPLVEIGGRPIVWHVIQIYAAQGFRRFLLLTGHRSELVEEFAAAEAWPDGVEVETVFTGEDTPTGGRVHRAGEHLSGGTFCVTYADGVADVDLREELGFHAAHGDLATMTVVRPELQFGVTELNGDGRVRGFHEKPAPSTGSTAASSASSRRCSTTSDESTLEREPLERLAADGQLHAWRHTGFWECMDTYKDAVQLNDLWAGEAPWKMWG